jgi:hypothetical protein
MWVLHDHVLNNVKKSKLHTLYILRLLTTGENKLVLGGSLPPPLVLVLENKI